MKPLSERLTERQLIQRGDLALAFRARDSVLDRPVFVKCLNPALAQDAEIRARFEREAKAVARLDHPNLVRIYEYGDDPAEGLYMLLEWLGGETLADKIKAGARFSGEDFTHLASQLLRGLDALHGVGILHRDLKPENIIARKTAPSFRPPVHGGKSAGEFKITDFSLAALRDTPKLTHHEAIVGTPAYMSPEQAAGGNPDERSDLFSLGVVLYEAATGDNPFLDKAVLDTLRNVREREVKFDHPALAELSKDALELLQKLLAKNPQERSESASLALAFLGEHVTLPVEKRRMTARDWKYMGVGLAVLIIWLLLMIFWPWESKQKAEPQKNIAAMQDTIRSSEEPIANVSSESLRTSIAVPKESEPNLPALKPKIVPEEKEYTLKAPATDTISAAAAAVSDSTNLWLITEPWAHVVIDDIQLGTTPLAEPLRLPAGKHELLLRNPAFPLVRVPLNLSQAEEQRSIKLADYSTLVRVNVEPWGELYLDGEHIGTTPLPRPLYVSPGKHSLRATHPQFNGLQKEFSAAAGETVSINMNFTTGHATSKPPEQTRP